ncbi:T9SS type A sorting domain-containing protein [bacterium]|nr:T9SS type A sorting domain-containing protein [bacterium]
MKNSRLINYLALSLALFNILPLAAQLQWTENGKSLVVTNSSFSHHQIKSDGDGGFFMTWENNSLGDYDIYTQHYNADGQAQWGLNGIVVSSASGDQRYPAVEFDGQDGVFVAWHDEVTGDIMLQHFNSNGAPQGAVGGIIVCNASGEQNHVKMTTDTQGGVIVAWSDKRTDSYKDIYAQRLDNQMQALWTVNGIAVCNATASQSELIIASDGAEGAYLAWQDSRNGGYDVYAQYINGNGSAQWAADGVGICLDSNDQFIKDALVTEDGFALCWEDQRNDNNDIYAQLIASDGIAAWTVDGIPVTSAGGSQLAVQMATDSQNDLYFSWTDNRTHYDIYAQKMNAAGEILWPLDGLAINTEAQYQYSPVLVADGSGGVWICWNDNRSGSDINIFYQHVANNGTLLEASTGLPMVDFDGTQQSLKTITDGSGGFIIIWQDGRDSANAIFSQHINQALSITSPESGVQLSGGQPSNINWNIEPASHLINHVSLHLSTDGGQNFDQLIADNVLADAYQFSWTPQDVTSSDAMIEIQAFNNQGDLLARYYSPAFSVDSEPPPAFNLISPSDGALTNLEPLFKWRTTTDTQSMPISYQVWMDAELLGENITDTVYVHTAPLAGGDHTWMVKAIDNAGQISESIQTWSFNASADHDPPTAFQLINPDNGLWSRSTSINFQWGASSDSESGLAGYRLYINNQLMGEPDASTTEYMLDQLEPGTHTWYVEAFDLVGNVRSSAARIFSIDPVAPQAFTLISPDDTSWLNDTTPDFTWTASVDTGIGLSHYNLYIDDQLKADHLSASAITYILPGDLALTEGSHTWKVEAVDLLGNVQFSQSTYTFHIDLNAPTVPQLLLPLENAKLGTLTPTLSWTASSDIQAGIEHYQILIDGQPYDDPVTATDITLTTDLSEDVHTWQVQVFDNAGNHNTSAIRTLIADVTPPLPFTLITPEAGIDLNSNRPAFKWQSTDDALSGFANFEFYLDGNRITADLGIQDTVFTVVEPMENGQHYWKVAAFDQAGNKRISEHIYFSVTTHAPVITSSETIEVIEDQPFSYTATATDEDGDVVQLSFEDIPSWCTVDGTIITGTPGNDTQNTTFKVIAEDNDYRVEKIISITFSSVNDLPSISEIADQVIPEDGQIDQLEFTVYDEETPANELVFIATSSDTNLVAHRDIIINGTNDNRTLCIVPKANAFGQTRIRLLVDDGTANSNIEFLLTVAPVNDRPVIAAISNQITNEDTAIIGIPLIYSDLETSVEQLNLSFEIEDVSIITEANISISTGDSPTITLTPLPDAFGETHITVRVSDGDIDSAQTFTLTVQPINDKPVISSALNLQGTEGETLVYTATASDPDGPGMIIRYLNIPTWMAVSGKTILGRPPEGVLQAQFDVHVSDGELSDTATVNIQITGINDIPQFIHALPDPVISDMDSLSFTLTLDEYIYDEDHADSLLSWSVKLLEAQPITISISHYPHIASIKGDKYFGELNFIFTATDPEGASISDTLTIHSIDTAVEDELLSSCPGEFELFANYPNPFNPATTIRFGLPIAGPVTISVFNVLGQKIEVLIDEIKAAGYHELQWHPENLPAGIYLYVIESDNWRKIKRMVYTK